MSHPNPNAETTHFYSYPNRDSHSNHPHYSNSNFRTNLHSYSDSKDYPDFNSNHPANSDSHSHPNRHSDSHHGGPNSNHPPNSYPYSNYSFNSYRHSYSLFSLLSQLQRRQRLS